MVKMTSLARRNSSIHKVQEHAVPKIRFESEYEVLRTIQDGCRGKILLTEHKITRKDVVLKAIYKNSVTRTDFFREFHYNYYLSPHMNIQNAYDVAFETDDYLVFAQEYAPFGDVTWNFNENGIGEAKTKKVAEQIASALEFVHSKDLVHRDITMDNILVFNSDFSDVKLCDFGATRKNGSLVKKTPDIWLPYAPPEIVDIVVNEGYYVDVNQDVWQFGVLLYILITGGLPWQKADMTCPYYAEYLNWRKRKTMKTPKRFSNFSNRALRLFKRLLEPKADKRFAISEVLKYKQDKWLMRSPKYNPSLDNQSLCYSSYSMHSSKPEKDKILHVLKAHGIETTVDRADKKKRINDWIEHSLPTKTQVNSISVNNNIEHVRKDSDKIINYSGDFIHEQNCNRSQIIGAPLVAYNESRKISETERKPPSRKNSTNDVDRMTNGLSRNNSDSSRNRRKDSDLRPSRKKGKAAARSHSARLDKVSHYHRSRSLAREPFEDYSLQRSKTEPQVDAEFTLKFVLNIDSDEDTDTSTTPNIGH